MYSSLNTKLVITTLTVYALRGAAIKRGTKVRDTKFTFLGTIPREEFTVCLETVGILGSHYVIAMSRRSKGSETEWGRKNLCE